MSQRESIPKTKRLHDKHCIVCGRQLRGSRGRLYYCSMRCRDLYHKYKTEDEVVRIPYAYVTNEVIHDYMEVYQGVPFKDLVRYLENEDIDTLVEHSTGRVVYGY